MVLVQGLVNRHDELRVAVACVSQSLNLNGL